MSKLITTILALLILGSHGWVSAEEVFEPGGKRYIHSLKEKLEQSRAAANLVVVGRFRVPPDAANPVDKLLEARRFVFDVEQKIVEKTPSVEKELKLEIPVYKAHQAPSVASVADPEVMHGGKSVRYDDYLKWVKDHRQAILAAPDYGTSKFLTPVRLGALDAPYREADVEIVPGKTYVLFLMGPGSWNGYRVLLGASMDIYDFSDPTVKGAVKP
jgi:hypothetical protein